MINVNRYLFLSLLSLVSLGTQAQYAGEAFRFSESNQTGTARFQGVGGNHAALGGDASNIYGNPAGLGFYNRSEFSISPAVSTLNTETDYIGTMRSENKGNFNIAQGSLIFTSQPSFQRKWKRSSFGLSFSRQQSLHTQFTYAGINDKSSFLDRVVEDANVNQYSIKNLEDDFDPGSNGSLPYAYSLPAAYYQLYLINPENSQTTVPNTWSALDANSAVDQLGVFKSEGASTQISLAYAGNYDDKLYVGGSVGLTRLRYNYNFYHDDLYLNSPDIVSNTKVDDLSVKGNGINLNMGIIYKLNPSFQLGGQVSSPTFSSVKETFNSYHGATFVDGMIADGEGNLFEPTYDYVDMAPNDFVYRITGPFKGSIGATYLVNRSGFVTGTIEYIGYAGMRTNTSYMNADRNNEFQSNTNSEIKNTYRNSVNVRLGGEYRVGVFRARAGIAYLADPYQNRNNGINREKIFGSLGVGVRKRSFFADLSGTVGSFKTAFTPYELNNPQNYYSASVKNTSMNFQLTMGVLFGE
ncbi:hypothetical protein [Dyadobacter tibetensis]|uniref:hypothetical protein n=1 Tax=Dyadobacter tibetensis TaxID=1211851 RepID=UPI0004728BBD|nr:hypothetical protein [Dyadobacter tibetensis]